MLAFVPWLEGVRLPPEVVLLIFLPALLYWESLTTSLREIRANLRAESLINDGTALVVFAIAVQAATGEREFGWGSAVGSFGLSYLGGAAAGLLTARLATQARQIVREPPTSGCVLRCWLTSAAP